MNSTTTPQPGCYVDSHWGQYGTARAIQVAADFGWKDEEASDLAARHLAAMGPSDAPGLNGYEFERLMDAAQEAEDWLNDQPHPPDHSWGWNDGDFGLWADEEE